MRVGVALKCSSVLQSLTPIQHKHTQTLTRRMYPCFNKLRFAFGVISQQTERLGVSQHGCIGRKQLENHRYTGEELT